MILKKIYVIEWYVNLWLYIHVIIYECNKNKGYSQKVNRKYVAGYATKHARTI